MPNAAVAHTSRNTGAAAATGTVLLDFAPTAGRQLEMLIRGSANASATIFGVSDNAFLSGGTLTGSPTTTVLQVTGASWTTDQHAGKGFVITASGVSANVGAARLILSNTSNTLTLASALPSTPASGDTVNIGNGWAAVTGQAWTADGGAGTSHAQWWEALNIYGASINTVTITVYWSGGSTGFTFSVSEISDPGGGASSTTAAAGNSGTPTCGSITGSGLLLAGYSCPTTNQTWSSPLDASGGATMTFDTPTAGTYRMAITDLHESSGTFAPRTTQSNSEGWVAIPLFIADTGGGATPIPPGLGPVVSMTPLEMASAQAAMMR